MPKKQRSTMDRLHRRGIAATADMDEKTAVTEEEEKNVEGGGTGEWSFSEWRQRLMRRGEDGDEGDLAVVCA